MRRTVPMLLLHNCALTRDEASAYIGGGPRLPNEALSFWKE